MVGLADRLGRRDDWNSLMEGHLVVVQIFTMEPILDWYLTTGPMGARNGDMDLGRIHVAQSVEVEGGLV